MFFLNSHSLINSHNPRWTSDKISKYSNGQIKWRIYYRLVNHKARIVHLQEIAPDPYLNLQKFIAMIEILPDYARVIE